MAVFPELLSNTEATASQSSRKQAGGNKKLLLEHAKRHGRNQGSDPQVCMDRRKWLQEVSDPTSLSQQDLPPRDLGSLVLSGQCLKPPWMETSPHQLFSS